MKWKKIYSDKVKRKLFKNLEIKILSVKSLLKARGIKNFEYKNSLEKDILLWDKNMFSNKINNICLFTGRHSSVYRLFRISRIELRKSSSESNIFGLKKSSW